MRRAGVEAEKEWREKEGLVGVVGLEGSGNAKDEEQGSLMALLSGDWTLQGWMDWSVRKVIRVEIV